MKSIFGSTVRASGLLLLASVCHASDIPLARTVAFAGVAPGPLSSLGLRGGGIQFWTNQNEIKAAPERWKGGLAKLRAMCAGTTVDVAAVGKASNLAGKWSKVDTVGQEKAMLMLGLPYVFRKGANLLSTVLLTTDSTAFNINTKGALVVSIKESYAYDGAVSACRSLLLSLSLLSFSHYCRRGILLSLISMALLLPINAYVYPLSVLSLSLSRCRDISCLSSRSPLLPLSLCLCVCMDLCLFPCLCLCAYVCACGVCAVCVSLKQVRVWCVHGVCG